MSSWQDKDTKAIRSHKLAVVILRAQPFHLGHLTLIKEALHLGQHVLVLLGSSYQARNIRNPFTFDERKSMIEGCFSNQKNITILPLVDNLYSDPEWVLEVQRNVKGVGYSEYREFFNHSFDVAIVGHKKDETSFYLDLFPEYAVINVPNVALNLDATNIRNIYFETGMIPRDVMPDSVENFLSSFKKTGHYTNLVEEYKFIKDYILKFANAPFPPTFVTTDAVVINNGYILLVKRRTAPGKCLWALPGGFLSQNESILSGTIRELEEETRIRIPTEKLRNSIRQTHVFDAPSRSLRGRIITHASLIQLYEKTLPKVRGSDDAERAKWFSITDFYNMREKLYEDHFSIATFFINRAE